MKTSIHVHKHSQKTTCRIKHRSIKKHTQVIEHTPVYDMQAFAKRQQQRKLQQFIQTLLSYCFVFITFTFSFSLLLWGV